ncbi:hypothetical protein ACFX2H_022074 [Malus domestica]
MKLFLIRHGLWKFVIGTYHPLLSLLNVPADKDQLITKVVNLVHELWVQYNHPLLSLLNVPADKDQLITKVVNLVHELWVQYNQLTIS